MCFLLQKDSEMEPIRIQGTERKSDSDVFDEKTTFRGLFKSWRN